MVKHSVSGGGWGLHTSCWCGGQSNLLVRGVAAVVLGVYTPSLIAIPLAAASAEPPASQYHTAEGPADGIWPDTFTVDEEPDRTKCYEDCAEAHPDLGDEYDLCMRECDKTFGDASAPLGY